MISKTSLQPIRKRLNAIIEAHFKALAAQIQGSVTKGVEFNESLLQDWSEMLYKIVSVRQGKGKQTKALNIHEINSKMPLIKQLSTPAPASQPINHQFLLHLQLNTCHLYEFSSQEGSLQINGSKLSFEKGYIHKYCSYNFIDESIVILVGGTQQSNPNMKSRQIFRLNIRSGEIGKVGELPYGVSSHSAIKVGQSIFIVGGNKDMNIVTKSCLGFTVGGKGVRRIGNLNYASASHSTLSWKDQFIYKFGGIGSCFGSFDISPYIERYSIEEDKWTVVNPVLKVPENLVDFFASSLAFVSDQSSILILGGFDFNFQGSNKLLEMKVSQAVNPEGEVEYEHQIINIGSVDKLQRGGFLHQEPVLVGKELVALQTVVQNKELQERVVSFMKSVRYF